MTAWERAVEAMTTLWPKGNPSQIEATALLTAALPALREMMAEELRAENFRLAEVDPRKHDIGDQMEWRKAADFLTRKEVMG